jgi:tetratricopeptide (TPR) repeat protein
MTADSLRQEQELIFNGINGATGTYLLPPLSTHDLSKIAKGDVLDKDHLRNLQLRHRQSSKTTRGVKAGVDPLNLSSAGWGIIFAREDGENIPAIKEALNSLLALRKSQAGDLYQEFNGEGGYQHGESYLDFLARHHVGPGPADPERVPYYLLIAGDPEKIPFDFQYQLDVQYAVGRIFFDTFEEYAKYAQSIVEMESGQIESPRQATFFGVRNQDDPATELSATNLVQPLAEKFADESLNQGWQIQSVVGEGATKSSLTEILGGDHSPSLFFSASHGMGFPKDDPRQLPHQGALLCQDWPGPRAWKEPIPEAHYFSADDVSSQAQIAGSIAFFFACYGAGTPQMDDFAHQAFLEPAAIAPRNFLAHLPLRLLSHPKGSMQAVIGHVERAWGYSFTWEQSGSQLAVFESALKSLMDGFPVGYAMEYFNARYAELSTILSTELQGIQFGKQVDDVALAGRWTANNDARSYVVIGDPAVRIRSKPVDTAEDSVMELVSSAVRESSPIQVQGEKVSYPILQLPPGSQVENIRAAIALLQNELAKFPPGDRDNLWIENQIQLANTYKALYEWTGDKDYFDQAEKNYTQVIDSLSPGEQLEKWATVRFNFAHLNHLNYEKGGSIQSAERAIQMYLSLLEDMTRYKLPLIMAQAHYYLASLVIKVKSENEVASQSIDAIDQLNEALTVYTADHFPYQYVDAKIKLGDLLFTRTEGDKAENIEVAIRAYESILNELSKVADLIPESSVYIRLGDAFAQRVKGERTNNLFQALAYYKQSLAIMKEQQDYPGVKQIEQRIAQLQ